MAQRFNDYKDGKVNMRNLHPMVYDENNVALAVRQLSKSPGRMAKGSDDTNYQTLENYSIAELAEIVKDRLLNKKMNYVRRTYIPKGKSGKMRPLGICSVWDKLVEKCIQLVIEPYCETKFVESSFAFREQVSAHNALAKAKSQCQSFTFALSIDMSDYFGTLDPNITYREMWHIGIKDQVILNYIFRFIKKGYFEDSCKHENLLGVPQGSNLGPLISNIYLHRFDVWLRDQGDCWHDKTVKKFHNSSNKRKNMRLTNLKIGIHIRYADDILILCKNRNDAERFRFSIINYLTGNMKLKINEEKTKIYDLTQERMKYLGYNFWAYERDPENPRWKGQYQIGNALPKAKEDEIVEKCREILRDIRQKPNFETIQAWNTYVVGIHNYYCGMNHFNECFSRIGWRVYKLFFHTMSTRTKFITDQSLKDSFMGGRYKSWGKKGYYCYNTFPMIQINWANWDSGLISWEKSKVSRKNPYDYGVKKHKPGVSMEDIEYLVNVSKFIKNSRLAMFRISKYSSTKGISYLSGEYVPVWVYHCHHIKPREKGGTNDFDNLCVLSETEHNILHSSTPERLYEMFPKKHKRIKSLIDCL